MYENNWATILNYELLNVHCPFSLQGFADCKRTCTNLRRNIFRYELLYLRLVWNPSTRLYIPYTYVRRLTNRIVIGHSSLNTAICFFQNNEWWFGVCWCPTLVVQWPLCQRTEWGHPGYCTHCWFSLHNMRWWVHKRTAFQLQTRLSCKCTVYCPVDSSVVLLTALNHLLNRDDSTLTRTKDRV